MEQIMIAADVPSSPAVLENNSAGLAAVPSTGGNTAVRLRSTFGACRSAVRGVTVLGGELYVLRMPANNNIEVFSIDSSTLQRHLSVPRLRDAVDMASCSRHFCLYVADDSSCLIRRVDARGSGVVHDWTAGEKPSGLSVTDGRVLVTCRDSGRLKLFTADGKLLQLVELEVSVTRPCHAVELAPSGYMVCHGSQGDHVHRVCVVSADGALLASYGGPRGSDADQLDFPRHLASLGDRGVLVADFNNRRVILLSPTLHVVSEISDQLLDFSPYRLCVDERMCVLFVGGLIRGSSDVGRLAAFDI